MPHESETELPQRLQEAAGAVARLVDAATKSVLTMVAEDGVISPTLFERHQHAAHGLAWLATYAEAIRQLAEYAERLVEDGRFGPIEKFLVRIGAGEYLDQMLHGIPMSQAEIVRLSSLGLSPQTIASFRTPAVDQIISEGNTVENRARLASLISESNATHATGDPGLDGTLEAMQREIRRFAEADVVPHAHKWHLENDYIPMAIIDKMAELGVFGLTIPEEFGGMGLSKLAMCVVSEELSKAYIGVGSLGTRSEIAAELILGSGTAEQKEKFLPGIASGSIIPTAVFTEPDVGSDLANLKTRASRQGDVWRVSGSKTWITHPVRADLMTMLVRTDPAQPGHRGLSILLAEKPRGTDSEPFPVSGLRGSEIEVIGYRGMKEYELAFEDFEVPAANLLGGAEGQGFPQLMRTFESARIQTAARAIGVAQSALELGLQYAQERKQFGKPLMAFPRVADKLVIIAAEIHLARQLTHFAGRTKDSGKRCDVEAGMAKLLAARVAWSAADNSVQIHGGNGFAQEYPISRVLCDSRILSIFEGAAEIQAQVIAKRLLDGALSQSAA
jgi:(2S)-methylsuccinyl-CoA dehydrogenase